MSYKGEYDDTFDYDYEQGAECDFAEFMWEYHEQKCGRLPVELGGGCQLTGTEYCDFECPFRDED